MKILIPPSTGMQGGGQQGGRFPFPGNPGGGCECKLLKHKINTKIKTILFRFIFKNMYFIYFK